MTRTRALTCICGQAFRGHGAQQACPACRGERPARRWRDVPDYSDVRPPRGETIDGILWEIMASLRKVRGR